jgi:serine protease Do
LLSLVAGQAPMQKAPAETSALVEVRLGAGRAVRGTLIKEAAGQVFVDVGPTIVALPRAAVLEIAPLESTSQVAPEAPSRAAGELFSRLERAELPVLDNVERVQAGVVLVKVPGALGSGFVIHADGWVVTNAHVIQGERNVSVTVFERRGAELAKRVFEDVVIMAVNPTWDLALLRIPRESLADAALTVIPFAEPDALRSGETVFAIGNPLGLERSVSEGIVSTATRANDGLLYVQTTAAINPGNSGGPLFNLRGEMVGVTTWGYLFSEGLNFAIPADTVEVFVRHWDAFAFDKENPNSGHRYLRPPAKGGPAR